MGVDAPCELGVLDRPTEEIGVEVEETPVYGRLVPVLGDPLPALSVGEIALTPIDTVEVPYNLLGCLTYQHPHH
jgi:hypothetical protein